MPDIRRPEEPRRVGGDQELLVARRRGAPDPEDAVAVVVVENHEEALLLPHEEARRAVARALARLGQREAEAPDPLECRPPLPDGRIGHEVPCITSGRLAQLVERLLYTQRVGGSSPSPPMVEATQVSLLRWLRRQLAQPTPLRERLEAAVENDDPAEARRLVARFEFSDAQRRNIDQLLEAWERTLDASVD